MKNISKTEYRELFFRKYLSMFDGVELSKITKDTPAYIEGTLTWDEEVRWSVAVDATPSENCLELVVFITANDLLEIDQISTPRKELFEMFNANSDYHWDEGDFELAVKELILIKVTRLDDGQEIDDFYVHL